MEIAILWHIFDLVGTIAFAISGTLVGISRRMDIFGMAILALATAIGGGIIRDMIVGYNPPATFRDPTNITLTLITTVIIFLVYRGNFKRYATTGIMYKTYILADAIGLAAFTVTGASVGVKFFPDLGFLSVSLALLTAVGGGIVRDILSRRIPSVLREDVYALPAILGGMLYYSLFDNGYSNIAAWAAFIFTLIFRMIAVRFKWSLPKITEK